MKTQMYLLLTLIGAMAYADPITKQTGSNDVARKSVSTDNAEQTIHDEELMDKSDAHYKNTEGNEKYQIVISSQHDGLSKDQIERDCQDQQNNILDKDTNREKSDIDIVDDFQYRHVEDDNIYDSQNEFSEFEDEIMEAEASFVPRPIFRKRKQKPRYSIRRYWKGRPYRPRRRFAFQPLYAFYYPGSLRI